MTQTIEQAVDYSKLKVVATRIFAAPRALVFRMWTDPAHVARWWGPHGFTNPVCRIDARAGGAIHIDMRAPDGTVYPMSGTFREVVAPERLSFASAALGADGKPMFETLTTVTFSERDGQTTQTLEAKVLWLTPGAERYLGGMEQGWMETLERLAAEVSAQ